MTDLAQALDDLRAASDELRRLNDETTAAIERRNNALRVAQDAGATYVVLQDVAGISAMTVAKVLGKNNRDKG